MFSVLVYFRVFLNKSFSFFFGVIFCCIRFPCCRIMLNVVQLVICSSFPACEAIHLFFHCSLPGYHFCLVVCRFSLYGYCLYFSQRLQCILFPPLELDSSLLCSVCWHLPFCVFFKGQNSDIKTSITFFGRRGTTAKSQTVIWFHKFRKLSFLDGITSLSL